MSEGRRTGDDERDAYRLDAQLLSDLWYFRAAARLGSITAAAQSLSVTQGAVSQRVLRLESRLGIELFNRQRGRIQLTRSGAILFEAMNQVSTGLNEALASVTQPGPGVLVVSCSPSLATEWLMPHLQDFYRECPEIELIVRAEMAGPSADWMREQRIDVLIDYIHGEAGELVQLAAVQEYTFPVCSRAYRRHLDSLPPDARRVVLMHDDDAWQEVESHGSEWQEWLAAAGELCDFSIKAERHFNLAYLAYQAAAYGQGVAMGRAISVNRNLVRGDLVPAFDMSPVPSAHHRILSLSPVSAEAPAARFAMWIEQAMLETQRCSLRTLASGCAQVSVR